MRDLLTAFINNAKLQALLDAKKQATGGHIEPMFSAKHDNCINHQKNLIDLSPVNFERLDVALVQLEKAREHLLGAMASLEGFNELSKRELLLAANFTHGYIYMLGEFISQKQDRTAKPVKGLVRLNG